MKVAYNRSSIEDNCEQTLKKHSQAKRDRLFLSPEIINLSLSRPGPNSETQDAQIVACHIPAFATLRLARGLQPGA